MNAMGLGVTMNDTEEPIVRMNVLSTYDLTVDVAGDGKTEAAAFKIYTPMKGATLPELYFSGEKNNLPTSTNGSFTFYIDVDVDAADQYLVIGAKDGSEDNYEIVRIFNTVTFSSDAEAYGLTVPVVNMCQTTTLNCSSAGLNADNGNGKNLYYIFLADTDISSDDFNPSDYPNGMYVEVNFSSKVDVDFNVILNSVAPGDESLYLNYSSSDSLIASFKDVIVVDGGVEDEPFHGNGGTISPTIIGTIEDNALSSTKAEIRELVNGQNYDVTVAFRNKYLFATKLSNQKSGSPLEIEAFLEENSCYLISAGFKSDHYVLDFLRHFRDSVLLKSSLGRAFIELYYSSAPRYARIIYSNEYLSTIFRGLGWISYFVIKYFSYIMGIIFILALTILGIKSELILGRNKKYQS